MEALRYVIETPEAKFGGLLITVTQPLVRLVRLLWANWDLAQNYGAQPGKEPELKSCPENMLFTPELGVLFVVFFFISPPKT